MAAAVHFIERTLGPNGSILWAPAVWSQPLIIMMLAVHNLAAILLWKWGVCVIFWGFGTLLGHIWYIRSVRLQESINLFIILFTTSPTAAATNVYVKWVSFLNVNEWHQCKQSEIIAGCYCFAARFTMFFNIFSFNWSISYIQHWKLFITAILPIHMLIF